MGMPSKTAALCKMCLLCPPPPILCRVSQWELFLPIPQSSPQNREDGETSTAIAHLSQQKCFSKGESNFSHVVPFAFLSFVSVLHSTLLEFWINQEISSLPEVKDVLCCIFYHLPSTGAYVGIDKILPNDNLGVLIHMPTTSWCVVLVLLMHTCIPEHCQHTQKAGPLSKRMILMMFQHQGTQSTQLLWGGGKGRKIQMELKEFKTSADGQHMKHCITFRNNKKNGIPEKFQKHWSHVGNKNK